MAQEGNESNDAGQATTESQAHGSSGQDVDQVKGLLDGFRKELTDWKNGFFADFRRSGGYKGEKPQAQPAQPAAQPQNGQDLETLMTAKLNRQRAFDRSAAGYGLSEKQMARAEEAFVASNPENVSEWFGQYASDMGWNKAAQQSAPPKQEPPTQAPHQLTSMTAGTAPGGSPPGQIRDPRQLTKDDVNALIREKGMVGAGMMLREAARKYGSKR